MARCGLVRRDAVVALCGSGTVLAIYAATMCPTVFWYDSAEYAAAAITLAPTHPPGYPLYLPIARLFTGLGPEPAWGVNFMSACFGAIAVGLAFVVARQLGVRTIVAAAGALALGLSRTFWANAVMAEVYLPMLAWLFATLVLLLFGLRRRLAWPLVLAGLWAGLGMGVHMSIATCGLGFAALVVGTGSLRRRIAVACASGMAAFVGTAGIFLTIPLRTFRRLDDPDAWRRFWGTTSGGLFKNLFAQQNAGWTYAERMLDALVGSLTWFGLVAAVVGLAVLFTRWRLAAVGLALAMIGNLWFFFDYRVHDIEVFFLPTIAIAFVCAAAGLDAVLGWIARGLPVHPVVVQSIALAAPLSLALVNWRAVDLSERTDAAEYLATLVEHAPDGAVFVSWNDHREWQRYAVLLYAQRAFGQRNDIRVRIRPTDEQLERWLADDVPVMVFVPTAKNRGKLRVQTDAHGLHPAKARRRRPA